MYEGDVSQSILQNPEKILREFDFREKPHAKIIKEIATFYKAYFKVFGIPENEYSTSGSEETFCFSVRQRSCRLYCGRALLLPHEKEGGLL